MYYIQIWFSCRLKKSKQTFNTKFVIWRPVKMTWTRHKENILQHFLLTTKLLTCCLVVIHSFVKQGFYFCLFNLFNITRLGLHSVVNTSSEIFSLWTCKKKNYCFTNYLHILFTRSSNRFQNYESEFPRIVWPIKNFSSINNHWLRNMWKFRIRNWWARS